MNYQEFIKSKYLKSEKTGFEINKDKLNPILFDYQKDLVIWALRQGKSAIFADTGLGKTFMQLEWAKNVFEFTNKPILILAPLAVSQQTIEEAKKINIEVKYCKNQQECINGINITNYERLENFNADEFMGIVLDESSCLKSFTSQHRTQIIDNFKYTPYKLACSATPAPNDYMELGNHSEFLNQMTRTEMLSMFFYHDGGDTSKWRLKKHATERFWEWVSSWAAIIKNPQDLGYDGSNHKLPELNEIQITVKSKNNGYGLFALPATTLDERREARRDSLNDRCQEAFNIVSKNQNEQWLIWCDLNDEANLVSKLIPNCINVQGSDSPETKAENLINFGKGKIKNLVTKPKIASYGMNWQSCHNMIFLGISDSFESYYQAIRRCYRFGQKNKVNVYIITSDRESNVLKNIQRKQKEFKNMQDSMADFTKKYVRENLEVTFKELDKSYKADKDMILPKWLESEV